MGLIAQWDTYNQDGANRRTGNHSIEIIDSQGGLNGSFSIDFENGWELIHGGSPKDRWPTIIPRTLRFTMKVTGSHHYQLVENIGTSRDVSRFIVVYKRGARPVFVGVILTQATTLILGAPIKVDGLTYYDGSFTITAVDGITLLQNQRMNLIYSDFRHKFNTHWFQRIFQDMPTLPYLVGNPFVFQTSWVPDTGTSNFMENQSIAEAAFADRENRLSNTIYTKFYSKWQILQAFCEAFNMRCINLYGQYIFQQLEDLTGPGYSYNKTFDYVGTNNVVSATTDLDADFLTMRAPEITSWSPPIRGSEVIYKPDLNLNLLLGNKFDLEDVTNYCYTDVSNVTVKTGLERLRIIGSIEFTPYVGTYTGLLRVVFYFTIKVGSNYYVREIQNTNDWFRPVYEAPTWQGSAGNYYEIYDQLVTMPDEDGRKFYIPVYFSSHRMETGWDDDPLTFCFGYELYGFDDGNPFGYQLLTKAEIDLQAFLMDLDVAEVDTEDNLVEISDRIVTIENNVNNDETISRTILFSTGPNTASKSRITDDSSPPVDTDMWTAPGLGSDKHYNILAKSLAARGVESSVYMETVLAGAYQEQTKLRACNAEWLWWTGTYYQTQHQEFHKGEFLRIKVIPPSASIVENDRFDIVERPPVPTKALAGGPYPAEIEITGITGSTINADTYNIPMPNTEGWTDEMIRSVVTYNRSGNIQRYKDPPTILNQFAWDNDNRNFVLAENSQSILWHIFRVYK